MPVMDGLVATSEIRRYEKETTSKPSCIIAVTGVASASMRLDALKAGVNNYMVKPLSLHVLKGLMGVELQ